jgi:putative membrane protein insertion efficiency factor
LETERRDPVFDVTGRPLTFAQRFVLLLLWLYQHSLGFFLGGRCRFYPSCSVYAVQAVRLQGVWVGLKGALWRLLRCHPWHVGGYDPVVGADAVKFFGKK